MVAIDARCHKRFNLLKDLVETKTKRVRILVMVIFPSCSYEIHFHYLFLCGLRVEDLIQFKDTTLSFVKHIEGGLVVRVCRHHHRLALLMLVLLQHGLHTTQHTNVA